MVLDLFLTFLRIGAVSFGGGYAMMSLINREVVLTHGWLGATEFVDLIAISESTPGPIAINAATYVGFKIAGPAGSVAATLGVIAVPFILMSLLGALFARYGSNAVVRDVLGGVRPVVVVLIASAAVSVAGPALTGIVPAVVAVLAAVGILVFKIDPVLLLGLAGVLGLILYL